MAIGMIIEDPGQSREQAERIQAHVRSTGPLPPEGARLMLAGHANPGWRAITVWDSVASRDRFLAERLAPAYEQAGLSPMRRSAPSSTSGCSSPAISPVRPSRRDLYSLARSTETTAEIDWPRSTEPKEAQTMVTPFRAVSAAAVAALVAVVAVPALTSA
jgi:hypothetical protein